MDTPMYLIAGFLESGKTTFITKLFEDDGFSMGERTIILMCEEGMEEYDEDFLKKNNAVLIPVEESDLKEGYFQKLDNEYKPERVFIEFNSTWSLAKLFDLTLPDGWGLVQMITLVDSGSFDNYVLNMRQMIMEPIREADVVVFNRAEKLSNKSPYRKLVRAANPQGKIYFETSDGEMDDGVTDEDLPYDMKADIIRISDEDFGTFYLDQLEHPDRYDGKKLRLKGMAFEVDGMEKNVYAFGRYAMTCCAADVSAIGFSCYTNDVHPAEKQWIDMIVKCKYAMSPIHGRKGLVFKQVKYKAASAPKEEIVDFSK